MLLPVSQCGLQVDAESSWDSFRLCTATPATSSETFHPSKLCLSIILCVCTLRNFSFTGDPEILACDAAGLSEGPRNRLLYEVDYFLLTHQFVTSRRHPESYGEYKKGSGMKMKNSGEGSDAAFAFLVERWCLRPDTMNTFSIDSYGRFKDDIIIVAKNRALTKHFVWGMKHRSKYYKIKVEVISDITVKFLEVRVWKDGSRFVTGPEFKPTSLWQPLGAVLMLLTAIHRGPLRASPCLERCREHQLSSRSQTGIDQQVYLALCTGAHHRKPWTYRRSCCNQTWLQV